MGEAAEKIEIHEPAFMRRFDIADLTTHGPWLLKRFSAKFPEMHEQQIAGYLRGLIYDNEHRFTYQDHAVALFQFVYSHGIKPVRFIQERFVWIEDKADKEQMEAAADFYDDVHRWARGNGAERIIVCEDTDVPKSLIEARLGRVYDTKISHVRV